MYNGKWYPQKFYHFIFSFSQEEARAKLGNNQVGRRPTKQTGSASKIPIVSTISSRHEQQATVPISTAINVPLSIGGKQINTFYNSSKGNIILQSSPIQETISSVATIVQVDSDSKWSAHLTCGRMAMYSKRQGWAFTTEQNIYVWFEPAQYDSSV